MEGEVPSGTYNIRTGVETNVNELYELLREASGRDLPPAHGPAKFGEQLRSSVDPTVGGRVFGWRPETELATGLRGTLEYFAAAGIGADKL